MEVKVPARGRCSSARTVSLFHPAGPHEHWRGKCVAGAQLAGDTLALELP